MPPYAPAFDLTLPAREKRVPAYRWLYAALRERVLEGKLKGGTRLPSTRDLARQYSLSRGTIVTAFELLASEGYIEGTIGSGTFVSRVLPDELLEVRKDSTAEAPRKANPRQRPSAFARRARLFSGLAAKPIRAFRSNLPAVDLFPTDLWAQIASRQLRRAPASFLMGCEVMGYRPLREAVANYLTTSRGVNCDESQVAIVSGVQEALEIAARLLLDDGDRVAMESPGYIGAAMLFEALGAEVLGVRVDINGMQVPSPRMRGIKLAYTTPGHQYPLGTTMALSRRLELLEWARKNRALIFEDDYDSEFRYAGRPVPALQGLDPHGIVLFAGSFNKVLFPSLRLGYLVLPHTLVNRFEAIYSVTRRHAPMVEQAIVTDFLVDCHFGRHLRRMRQIYAERLETLLDCARQRLTGMLEVSSIEAGLQTVGWLPQGVRAEEVQREAATRAVEVTPLAHVSEGTTDREGVLLGFAAVSPREIRRGVEGLLATLEGMSPKR